MDVHARMIFLDFEFFWPEVHFFLNSFFSALSSNKEATRTKPSVMSRVVLEHSAATEQNLELLQRNVALSAHAAKVTKSALQPLLNEADGGQAKLASIVTTVTMPLVEEIQQLLALIEKDMARFATAKSRHDMLKSLVVSSNTL